MVRCRLDISEMSVRDAKIIFQITINNTRSVEEITEVSKKEKEH